MADHHTRCVSIEFTTLSTANHGVCKNVLACSYSKSPTVTVAYNPACIQTRRICHPRPFSCAQTARPTCQCHLFPSTRLALSRLRSARGLLAVPPVLAPRQNSARRLEGAGLLPRGPTATPHIESPSHRYPATPAQCHLPSPGLLGMRIAVTCIHSGTRSWQTA